MQQSHSSQLETIKSIEYNLLSLKSRLCYLQKQQERTSNRMYKLLESSIPIIKNKITESNNFNKTKTTFQTSTQAKISKNQTIKTSKIEHQQEQQKNKIQVTRMKIHGSLHVREMSRKNQKIIQDAKKQWVEEKKKKSQLVKACRIEAKRKIEEFYVRKREELRKIKEEEAEQLDKKIMDISYSFAQASKTQSQQQKKQQKIQKQIQKFQKVLRFLQNMRPQVFQQIKQQLNLSQRSLLTDQLIQQILIQTEKRSKNSKPEALRLSLDQTRRKLNKINNSDEGMLKSIYVYGNLKKIR